MDEKLPPELLAGLSLLPENAPVAFLTRHSIREEPQNGFASYDVPLTAEGVDLAKWLGRALDRPIHAFRTSPVGRCIDTAKALAEGAGIVLDEVDASPQLVEPGSYVTHIEQVGGLFFKLGPIGFANKHLRNEVRGVKSPSQGTMEILEYLKADMGEPGSLSIHVTHDTILAAFVYSLLAYDVLDESHWPQMMEGAFVWFENNTVNWVWRGQAGQRELPL